MEPYCEWCRSEPCDVKPFGKRLIADRAEMHRLNPRATCVALDNAVYHVYFYLKHGHFEKNPSYKFPRCIPEYLDINVFPQRSPTSASSSAARSSKSAMPSRSSADAVEPPVSRIHEGGQTPVGRSSIAVRSKKRRRVREEPSKGASKKRRAQGEIHSEASDRLTRKRSVGSDGTCSKRPKRSTKKRRKVAGCNVETASQAPSQSIDSSSGVRIDGTTSAPDPPSNSPTPTSPAHTRSMTKKEQAKPPQ
ncbi:hypothetical protein DVH05_008742 [Phytophthora capsici]|nr:hypothetical protein DVH05_008742 [Phytophthora capsici]